MAVDLTWQICPERGGVESGPNHRLTVIRVWCRLFYLPNDARHHQDLRWESRHFITPAGYFELSQYHWALVHVACDIVYFNTVQRSCSTCTKIVGIWQCCALKRWTLMDGVGFTSYLQRSRLSLVLLLWNRRPLYVRVIYCVGQIGMKRGQNYK